MLSLVLFPRVLHRVNTNTYVTVDPGVNVLLLAAILYHVLQELSFDLT